MLFSWRLIFYKVRGSTLRVSLQASCILLMVIPILITCVSTAIVHRQFLFDDSFITYRYAKNLADGNGIVFNPGDPPTEGYTPLLLVLLLAPFLKIGLDPLVITRVLSFLSAIGLSACIFFSAKRRFRCTTISASIVASIPFLFSDTVVHCMTGMETMLYTLCLFLCFLAGVQFIRNQSLKWSLIFSSILFLCTLFRPEGFLLYIAFLILCGIQALRKDSILLRPLIAGAGLLFAMGMVYGIWKVFHFGYILPNAFFIKANTPFFFSEMGVASVVDFLVHYSILLALVLSSAILAGTQEDFLPRESNKVLIWGSIFVTLYVIFFATVDTLQDIGGRFLYPCMAILVLLSMPSLVRVIDWMTSDSILKGSATIGACIMVYLVFQPIYLFQLITNTKQMIYYGMRGGGIDDPYSLVQREMQIGKDLAEYPDISRIRLMVGDAGVIPYFSEAICLDPVGLNDTFIARNRDPQAL